MYGLRDRRKKDWFWGEKSAIQRLENDAQVATYVALLILSGEGSLVWASQDTIARVAHNSTRTVARTLPELERLQVLRRASDEALERLAERLGEIPATIVYELVSVEILDEPEREPEVEMSLVDSLMSIRERGLDANGERAALVAAARKYLAQQTHKNIDFGWLVRLYNQALLKMSDKERGQALFATAAIKTAEANPRGEPMAYMASVIRNWQAEPQEAPDLSNETQKAFGEW